MMIRAPERWGWVIGGGVGRSFEADEVGGDHHGIGIQWFNDPIDRTQDDRNELVSTISRNGEHRA